MTDADIALIKDVIAFEMRKWLVLGPQEIEDMSSNAWCIVLERWPKYDEHLSSKRTFISQCISSANLDWYRRFYKPRTVNPDEDPEAWRAMYNGHLSDIADYDHATEQRRTEARVLLLEMADVLTDKEKEIVSWILAGDTLKQIGRRLNVTESRASQITTQLKRKMKDRGRIKKAPSSQG